MEPSCSLSISDSNSSFSSDSEDERCQCKKCRRTEKELGWANPDEKSYNFILPSPSDEEMSNYADKILIYHTEYWKTKYDITQLTFPKTRDLILIRKSCNNNSNREVLYYQLCKLLSSQQTSQ